MRPGSLQRDVIALYYAQFCAIPTSREEGYNYVTSKVKYALLLVQHKTL